MPTRLRCVATSTSSTVTLLRSVARSSRTSRSSMPSWKTPTPQQIERAVALLAHPVDQARFFEELQNPQWLAPLNARGFFASPPGQEGAPSFAPWPASAYLARMAVHAPDEVLAILLKMKATKNVRVRQDVVDAALAMPPALAAQLVSRNMTWMKE